MRTAFTVTSPTDKAFRALNYSPYLERFQRPRKGARGLRLGDLLVSMGPAFGDVFTRIDCDPLHGVELVSQTDMFDSEPSGRVIRKDSMANPELHRIRRWQLLIAGAGTLGPTELYGRCIIADSRLEDKYVGPHAMVLTFQNPGSDESLYVYAFFCTRVGIEVIRSTSYGTKILSLRKDFLGNLRVPDANASCKSRVASLVRTAVERREEYSMEIRTARAAIATLPEMKDALEQCRTRKARCSLWNEDLASLSAWNSISTGRAIGYLRKRWKRCLADVLVGRGVFNGPRFARIPCQPPFGIEFYSQRDLFLIKRVPRRIIHPGFDDELLFVPEGSLLVGGHGTLGEGEIFGRVVYVSGRLCHAGFTQDLLRVIPTKEMAALAYTFFSTFLGFRMLRSTAVGTKLLTMRPDFLRALPFPEISSGLHENIRGRIDAAVAARKAADDAEDEAVRIIEQEVLPSWLD